MSKADVSFVCRADSAWIYTYATKWYITSANILEKSTKTVLNTSISGKTGITTSSGTYCYVSRAGRGGCLRQLWKIERCRSPCSSCFSKSLGLVFLNKRVEKCSSPKSLCNSTKGPQAQRCRVVHPLVVLILSGRRVHHLYREAQEAIQLHLRTSIVAATLQAQLQSDLRRRCDMQSVQAHGHPAAAQQHLVLQSHNFHTQSARYHLRRILSPQYLL